MLTFTPTQMAQLQQVWQLDQLLLSMPEIVSRLQQINPYFWSLSTLETHQHYYTTQAEKWVTYGMVQAHWLEKLIGMEYQYQCPITKKPWLDWVLKLDWLVPDDRLDLIDYLYRLQQRYALTDPFPYAVFSVYPLKLRLAKIADFLNVSTDSENLFIQLPHVLHQGLYYALLQSVLPQATWQVYRSDWKKSLLVLMHPKLQRSVQLQVGTLDSGNDFILTAEPLAQTNCLTITVPLQLTESHVQTLENYLKAWCISLEPSTSETFRGVLLKQNAEEK